MAHFLHTADLHLGRAFKSFGNELATQLAEARYQVVEAIARQAVGTAVDFVVIAGDLFDSAQPSGKVLAKALQALGKIDVPVYCIPGNHDPGGPLGPYERPEFLEYQQQYAKNLHVLQEAKPVVLNESRTVLLPCPVIGRPSDDPTAWLRDATTLSDLPADYARVVLAHGGTIDFSSDVQAAPELNLARIEHGASELDYIALGDWHGSMHVLRNNIWYSGTPEPDKYPLNERYTNGVTLEVSVERGQPATITPQRSGRYDWAIRRLTLRNLEDIEQMSEDLLASTDAGGRLLKLSLDGSLNIDAARRLAEVERKLRDVYEAVEIDQSALLVAPGDDELQALTEDARHPTLARVATTLKFALEDPVKSRAARLALVKLYEATQNTQTA